MRVPLLVAALLLVLPARAALAVEVTFAEAIDAARGAPLVAAAERALAARAEGDLDLPGRAGPLQLTALPGARLAPQADRGPEAQVTLSQSFHLADAGGARREAARSEREALRQEARAAALEQRLEAARRWLELRALEEQMALARQELGLAQALDAQMERAAAAGLSTAAEREEARAFAAEVELRAVTLEGQRLESAVALALALGRPPAHDLTTGGSAPQVELPPEPALHARLTQAARAPRAAAARLLAAAARAREAELRANNGVTLQVGAQLELASPGGVSALGLVGLTLPWADPGARERSLLRAEQARRHHEERQVELQAAREGTLAWHEVEHSREVEAIARDRMVPALQALAERREAARAAGEGTTALVLEARRRLLAARGRLAEASGLRLWAEIKAWLLLAALAEGADR